MRTRRHTIRRCNPVSQYELDGYARLLEAIFSSFGDGIVRETADNPVENPIIYSQNFPKEPEIAPTSCIWVMVENDPARWN
jgi:hypothetical protein